MIASTRERTSQNYQPLMDQEEKSQQGITTLFSGLAFPEVPSNPIPVASRSISQRAANVDYVQLSDNPAEDSMNNINESKDTSYSSNVREDTFNPWASSTNQNHQIQNTKTISNNAVQLSNLYTHNESPPPSYPSLSDVSTPRYTSQSATTRSTPHNPYDPPLYSTARAIDNERERERERERDSATSRPSPYPTIHHIPTSTTSSVAPVGNVVSTNKASHYTYNPPCSTSPLTNTSVHASSAAPQAAGEQLVAQLITENETLQHQLHSLRSSMATPAITVRATPVPSETPSATPLPLSVMAEQVSASHQSRSPSLPLPLTPVEAHFTQQQIEEQEAIWNTIQQQRRQPLQQSQSARSLPLETSITTPPTTLSRQASHPAPMTSQQAHQYFNTYSNHTMAAQTKYVCCGMCRQW
eukprot:CAMPEP_0182428464 /NCGR_PEP_ID=MMETSP1167-20130531/23043_1 /TAXON_ID=2988 /ORGANISM="Mallomonas Sp, Strain CCMP3275" /LENGTH=412 /DNA_ID=CAMNT_0024611399 /DNA_START=166 /DNA_END=1401 /DNA_ORIENTATION=+